LAQLVTKQSRSLLTKLGVLTKEELESRYHVRMERYIKDMLIEMHTLQQIVDTLVLPAAFTYSGQLAASAAHAKAAGIRVVPQADAANEVGSLIEELRSERQKLAEATEKAEHMHDDVEKCAKVLTSTGADAMAAVRSVCDKLELVVADELWPLPKYREMLFPV
jgi:glutamine synthetase